MCTVPTRNPTSGKLSLGLHTIHPPDLCPPHTLQFHQTLLILLIGPTLLGLTILEPLRHHLIPLGHTVSPNLHTKSPTNWCILGSIVMIFCASSEPRRASKRSTGRLGTSARICRSDSRQDGGCEAQLFKLRARLADFEEHFSLSCRTSENSRCRIVRWLDWITVREPPARLLHWCSVILGVPAVLLLTLFVAGVLEQDSIVRVAAIENSPIKA